MPANQDPDAQNTLRRAVARVNALDVRPDFIVFTGDLTHTTDDPLERRKRMTEFKAIVAGLKVRVIRDPAGGRRSRPAASRYWHPRADLRAG